MPPKATQALEEAIAALSDHLSDRLVSMEQRQDSLVATVSDIQQQLAALAFVSSFQPSSAIPSLPPFLVAPLAALKPPKLLLQPFDGFAPSIGSFMPINISGSIRFPLPSALTSFFFYMKGEALNWFKWMYTNRQLSSWDAFVHDLELHFGPSTFDNHQVVLFKLRQRGLVAEFQVEFERVCNGVVVLPLEAILNCFLSGLHADIQRELAVLQPSSLSQAFGLARLVESKPLDGRPPRLPLPAPLPSPPLLPARRFSLAELQDRRAKGLCFHCDEKFGLGHK
ncbi:UNVERIFIED_CONTAM: hypothetical protein Slati_3823300 [Sesamum latifolium]|uniref:Retrotransposon gag domain-containing protein n=1 Tax=Sesamum latifolium TaxID=2727402 RepID=A0AAW2TL07_9LAMI